MEYSKIIEKITGKLTGDIDKDVAMLQKEAEKYMDHEYSEEILRAVGRVLTQVMPNDEKDKIYHILSNLKLSTDAVLDEVKLKIREGDLDKAESIIKSILPHEGKYQEDKVSVYFAFNNQIEVIYYKSKFNPQKDIRFVSADIDTEVFLTYAYILIEKKKFDEAMDMLDRGLKYNPLDTELLFEKGEIFKLRKDWEEFKKVTDMCMEYSYSPESIARAYRNYGFMFIELKDYDAAICCYLMSLQFDRNNMTMAQSQLYYISKVIDSKINEEEYFEVIDQLFEERGIQIGANPELLDIAFALGQKYEEDKVYEDACYFYSVVYNLTGDEEIRKRIESIDL